MQSEFNMKKISVWKMVGLYVITLGIYSIVWMAKRRTELMRHTKVVIPHWLWLVIPIVLTITGMLATILVGRFIGLDEVVSLLLSMLVFSVGSLVAFAISLWWMHCFGKAVEVATHGKFPYIWTMLYWIFLGVVTLFAQQYWLNRTKKGEKNAAPTKRFITLSIVVICLSFVVGGVLTMVSVATSISLNGDDIEMITEKSAESERLYKDHEKCMKQLEADFPGDLTEDNEADYGERYDKCEDIRMRQNKVVEELQKL